MLRIITLKFIGFTCSVSSSSNKSSSSGNQRSFVLQCSQVLRCKMEGLKLAFIMVEHTYKYCSYVNLLNILRLTDRK